MLERSEESCLLAIFIETWMSKVKLRHMSVGLRRIKLRLIHHQVKGISRNSEFDSISTSSHSSAFNSINDFKPILSNYSSVHIFETKATNKSSYTDHQYTFDKTKFAEYWMLRKHIKKPLMDHYPPSQNALKNISAYNKQALQSIYRHPFREYVKSYVKPKIGLLGGIVPERMEHRKKSLSTSLTHLKEEELAVDLFDLLLEAGGDVESEKGHLSAIGTLISLVYDAGDDIKEEMYLQVCKQMQSHNHNYVKVLCCLAVCVSPSVRIYLPLLNFLLQNQADFDNLSEKSSYNFAFYTLIKNFNSPRTLRPSLFEVSCHFHRKKIPIIVVFPREKMFFIEAHTTIEQFTNTLVSYYNLDSDKSYLLEINNKILYKGFLLQELNRSSNEKDYLEEYHAFQGLKALLLLKDPRHADKSPLCRNIHYNYCVQQYLKGVYALRTEQIVTIAALKMLSEIEDEENYQFDLDDLVTKRRLRVIHDRESLKHKILSKYFEHRGSTRDECRDRLMGILETSKGYNTHFFLCNMYVDDFDPVYAWVGLKINGFIIIEPQTGRIMRNLPYNQISEWGGTNTQLCLKVHGVGVMHIESLHAPTLTHIFEYFLQQLHSP